MPAELPGWLTQQDIDAYVAQYAQAGFTGPLNWYRNMDRNWELTAAWHHAPVLVPALFMAGERDPVDRLHQCRRAGRSRAPAHRIGHPARLRALDPAGTPG